MVAQSRRIWCDKNDCGSSVLYCYKGMRADDMVDVRRLPEDSLLEMQKLLGEEHEWYLKSLREEWKPGPRANIWEIDPWDLTELVPWDLEPVPWTDNGFYYNGSLEGEALRPSKYPTYCAEPYCLQEPSAMALATMLPVIPGDRVLGPCATPGGKSTELALRLKGRGMLVSNDVSYFKARALPKNLELAGATNICVTGEAPEKLACIWPECSDKILTDASCSGEDIPRRDEGMVKDQKEKGPEYYVPIQWQVLSQAAAMLKPGRCMMYSTCTFSVEKDEGSVPYILEEFPQVELCYLDLGKVPGACGRFRPSGCMWLFPYRLRGEGHSLALVREKGGDNGEARAEHSGVRGAVNEGIFRSMDKGALSFIDPGTIRKWTRAVEKKKELGVFLGRSGMERDYGRIVIYQGDVCYPPGGLAWNLLLRFLRMELLLDELKKRRFRPSQALAMPVKAGQFPNTVSSPTGGSQALCYLKGETVSLEVDKGSVRGWRLAAMEGFPPGWAKDTGMSLKNRYYPG